MANAEVARDQFVSSPFEFLQSNFVSIAGGGSRNSGVQTFLLCPEEILFSNTGMVGVAEQAYVVTDKQGREVKVTKKRPMWKIVLKDLAYGKKGAEFDAYYVAMKNIEQPDGSALNLPATGDHDVMITSQLTGCTFGIGAQIKGGCCRVAHIEPKRGSKGSTERDQALSTAALGGNIGYAFQLGSGYSSHTAVVGKRDKGIWKFYCQEQGQAAITRVAEIT